MDLIVTKEQKVIKLSIHYIVPLSFIHYWKINGHGGKVGPSPGTIRTHGTLESPCNHPGATSIPRDVMHGKDVLGKIINFFSRKILSNQHF